MKAQDIQLGGFYDVKVGGRTTVVRIMQPARDGKGGFDAITVAGDKDIRIRSADRIVRRYNPGTKKR
ncbi:MAG: hypothetical protein GXY41_06025 [Phycisphaerae bacterium]|nr:hypothetical protein [Phycisphaerae bacterium]